MAFIESIRIRNLRCIRSAELVLPPGVVWVKGPNGAGKTTLLEGLYLLDRGRTFRGRRGGPLTRHGARLSSVVGSVVGERGRHHKVSWDSAGSAERPSVGQFTRFVGSTTFSILEDDPDLRRRFFDWALFHVEPSAREIWGRVARGQRQRNAWLRNGGRGAAIWDAPYASDLDALWRRRALFAGRIADAFGRLTGQFLPVGDLRLEWQWIGQGQDLAALLRSQRAADTVRGFTFLSPSRGDIVFLSAGKPWRGSRGENKVAGILLQLAAQQVMVSETAKSPIVLLDDPLSEVSSRYLAPIMEAWTDVADQVVVTSLDDVAPSFIGRSPDATFHVEQGGLMRL